MYPRILSRLRRLVLEQQYIVTIHADDELNADDLSVYDLEHIVLSGRILERQRDVTTGEGKYRMRGKALDGTRAETIMKISPTGMAVFITVYVL
jgi:hypothetical protein